MHPIKKLLIEAIIICSVFSLMYGFLFVAFGIDQFGVANSSVYSVITFLRARKLIRVGVHKLLFMLGVVVHTSLLASSIAVSSLQLPLMYSLASQIWFLPFIPIRLMFYCLIGGLVYLWFSPLLRQIESRDMKGLWLIPMMIAIILYYFIATDHYPLTVFHGTDTVSTEFPLVFLLIAVLSFAVYLFLLRMLGSTARNARLESDFLAMNRQLETQAEYYKTLQSHIIETKKARHDFRHHLSIIQSYAVAGETEKLNEYLREYMEYVPSGMEIAYCENYAINAILHYYANIARSEGVEVSIRVELPEETGISDTDLCIVFGNCIENAIEACRKVNESKFIKINSKLKGEMFIITVDNSFNGEIRKDGDVFLSSKREGDGIGITSVKAIADKYGESAQFEADGSVFQAMVILLVQ
jgi:sensor histidine kinase YesM